ncbi:MAG: molybdopterin cofactor-binding domain-containing protein [Gemmatimonas sp.]
MTTSASTISRRAFLGTTGVIVIGFTLAPRLMAQEARGPRLPGSLSKDADLDAWLRVEADGTVTVFTGKAELGQGIRTSLTQIAAEELDLPIARVRMITADTAQTPNEGYTAGSQSIQDSGSAIRQAAAEARAILIGLAAERLNVPADRLETADGAVRVAGGGGQSVTYGDLLAGKKFDKKAEGKVKPKDTARYAVVGTSVERLDLPAKVYGRPAYVQDIRLPGMVHGRVVQPPSYSAKLVSADEAGVARLPGVLKVMRDGSFLGVIAEREDQAIRAMEALRASAKWQEQKNLPDMNAMPDWLRSNVTSVMRVVDGTPKPDAPVPDPIAKDGVDRVEATFTKPYIMHGSMGPSAAVAHMTGGMLTVWSHTQGVYPLRDTIALMLKMEKEKVRVIHAEGAGCYGHNAADDAAGDAAMLAAGFPDRPVRVQWMRHDEHGWEPYNSAMVMDVSAGLKDGRIAYWNYDLYSTSHGNRPRGKPPGSELTAAWHKAEAMPLPESELNNGRHYGEHRNADPIYDVGDARIVRHFVKAMPIRVSSTRSLGAYANVFAIESFMDELAYKAKIDPVVFRLNHLKDERAREVLTQAARRAGWRERTAPNAATSGNGSRMRGQGVGFAQYKNEKCYAAMVVDLEVDRTTGAVQLLKTTIVGEAGQYINPDGMANQLEGGFIQSASWTLKEQVTFDNTRITSRDWAGYPILTFPETPEVETHLINRSDLPSLGAGEATQGPSGAAIANAIFDATGMRLRDLPLTPDKIKAAIG